MYWEESKMEKKTAQSAGFCAMFMGNVHISDKNDHQLISSGLILTLQAVGLYLILSCT